MNEETAIGRREGYPGIMHDLNLNALKDYAKEQPNNPAAGLLVSSSRIALETQAIATEAMSVAAYCGAFFNSSQGIAPGYEYATQAYDLGIKCQQHACLVANKFADLTHALRMGCLRASLSDAARFQSDLRQKALNHCVHLAHLAVSARESEAAQNPVLPMAEDGKDAGLDLISGRVMGYLPLSRLVQIQPASGGPPLELNNWPGAGEVNFNRFLGREVDLYLTRGPRPAILNVVAP